MAPAGPRVEAVFDDKGLSAVLVDGKTVPLFSQFAARATLTDAYRNPYELKDPYVTDSREMRPQEPAVLGQSFDATQHRLTQTYAWGTVATTYTVNRQVGGLDLSIAIQNTGKDVIEAMHLTTMGLRKAPGVLAGQRLGPPLNLGGVGLSAVLPNTEPGLPQVVVGSSQANRPLYFGWEGGHSNSTAAALVVTFGNTRGNGEREAYDGVWNFRAIKPGVTETVLLHFRFGPASDDPSKIATDLLAAFAKAVPFRLRWPDRRPVTMMQLEYGRGEANNPRGWWGLKDRKEDIRTPEGRAIFDKWIMANADQAIRIAEQAGAQGVIVWDLEGGQYPGSKYYGDPRIMPYTAPEMEAVADAYFKKLREAGLRVGVCLRPHWNLPIGVPADQVEKYRGVYPNMFRTLPFRMTWDKFNIESYGIEFWGYDEIAHDVNTPLSDVKRSPVQRLDDMIAYCKKRWGATLFYVDTNYFSRPRAKSKPNTQGGYDELGGWTAKMMSAEQWAEVQRRHPDCLLMPEHEYTQYWASTAPYRQPPHDGPTPPDVAALWLEAFSSIAMNGSADAEIKKALPVYIQAIERGDLLMTHGWYGPAPVLMEVYTAAAATAPVKVSLLADGALTLQGQPVADLKALQKQVAKLVKGKPFADRRVFVQYAAGTEIGKRTALIAALEQADAIIAWSQPIKQTP